MLTYPVGLLRPKAAPIPTAGLIGEWLFSGNANDTSGEGNDGVVTGATLTANKDSVPNSAYNFNNSSSDIIKFGDPVVLRDLHSADFSISIWARDPLAATFALATLWSSWQAGGQGVLIRSVGPTPLITRSIRIDAYFSTTNLVYVSDEIFPFNTWYNLIITFDFSTKTAKIYMNGVEVTYRTTTAGSGTVTSDSGDEKELGMLSPTSTLQSWVGDMDLVRMYNRILTQLEITILANE